MTAANPPVGLEMQAYLRLVDRLNHSVQRSDDNAFLETLDRLVTRRSPSLQVGLQRLATELRESLRRCSADPAVQAMAEHDVPDARERLAHVMTMTDEAAHLTLGLVEQCTPLASGIAGRAQALLDAPGAADGGDSGWQHEVRAFLASAAVDGASIGANLTQVLLAQGYQDLTGQIIKRLIDLIGDVEKVMQILVRLGEEPVLVDVTKQLLSELGQRREGRNSNGTGPAVPNGTAAPGAAPQADMDSLFADLGI
jgi:chemotaxis protein CheZ